MTNQTLAQGGEAIHWGQTIYAFLAEKERRSGSLRTVQAYSRMLFHFFGALGKTPEEVTSPDVFSYAHSVGLSGKKPSSVTIAARIACLSSFYRFLIRMSLVTGNPCDKLERPDFEQRFSAVVERLRSGETSRSQAARELGIGYATLHRLLEDQHHG